MRNGICNSIVFYDIDLAKVDLKGWYEYVLGIFSQYNQIPLRGAIDGKDIAKSTTTKTFKHVDKMIKKNNFINIDAVDFASYIPNHEYDLSDFIFSTENNLEERKKYITLYLDNSVINVEQIMASNIPQKLQLFLNAGYGIFYQRDFNKGPNFYAYGFIGNSGYSREEENLISKWCHIYGDSKRYQHGDLRDIYPYNFISQAHLDRQVDSTTLGEWIKSSNKHGTLKPLTENMWTWAVSSEQIDYVRETLRSTGIVKCI